MAKPKALSYELIPKDTPEGREVWELMRSCIKRWHRHLTGCEVKPAWMLRKKPDVDGRLVLGTMQVCSELDRKLHGYDAVLKLNQEAWQTLSTEQRLALVDHELCHLRLSEDADGEPREDEEGRKLYRIAKHDVEEFNAVLSRHGIWKSDLVAAIEAARQKDPNLNLFETRPPADPAAAPTGVSKVRTFRRAPAASDTPHYS